jgi:hypothetical protein
VNNKNVVCEPDCKQKSFSLFKRYHIITKNEILKFYFFS